MAFEMICGQCRGNLLVEHFGVVVACPHCGAHLHIPAPADATPPAPSPALIPEAAPPPEPVAVIEPPAPTPTNEERAFEPAPPTEEMAAFTGDESELPPSVEIAVTSPVAISESVDVATETVSEETPTATTSAEKFSLSALISSSESVAVEPSPAPSEPLVQPAELPTESSAPTSESPEPQAISELVPEPIAEAPTAPSPSGLSGLFGSETSAPPPETTTATAELPVANAEPSAVAAVETSLESESSPHDVYSPVIAADSVPSAVTKSVGRDHVIVSKALLLILISYCSAITLGFGYLLYRSSTNTGEYGLESLPDVLPPKKKTSGIYREATELPEGHDLQIGDTQRFGNIEVTVVKVSRGPIQFRHFSAANKSKLPTAPVLKLWLRFKNVSTDQEIAPLDDQLLFARIGKDRFNYRSNQFVVRASQKMNPNAKRIIAFDHTVSSGWDLANLPLDKPLQPGESRDYYVPTCENDLEVLTGELVWRVHIRKGYSTRGNGVTTLFEVRFNSGIISDETA